MVQCYFNLHPLMMRKLTTNLSLNTFWTHRNPSKVLNTALKKSSIYLLTLFLLLIGNFNDAFGQTCPVSINAGNDISICTGESLDLSLLSASFTGSPVNLIWTGSGSNAGTGLFDLGSNSEGFGTATTYIPSAGDQTAGSFVLTLVADPMAMCTSAELMDDVTITCLLYTSPSPRDATLSRMPSSA